MHTSPFLHTKPSSQHHLSHTKNHAPTGLLRLAPSAPQSRTTCCKRGRAKARTRIHGSCNYRKAGQRNRENYNARIEHKEQLWAPKLEEAFALRDKIHRILVNHPPKDHPNQCYGWMLQKTEPHHDLWEQALSSWTPLLKHTKAWVRAFATRCLPLLPKPEITDLLLSMCHDKALRVRRAAFRSLGECGDYTTRHLSSFLQLYLHSYKERRRLERLFLSLKLQLQAPLEACFHESTLSQKSTLLRLFALCELPIDGIFDALLQSLIDAEQDTKQLVALVRPAFQLLSKHGAKALSATPLLLKSILRFERDGIFLQGLYFLEVLAPHNGIYCDIITQAMLQATEGTYPTTTPLSPYTLHKYEGGQEYEWSRRQRETRLQEVFGKLLLHWTKQGRAPSLSLWYNNPNNPLWKALSQQEKQCIQEMLPELHDTVQRLEDVPASRQHLLEKHATYRKKGEADNTIQPLESELLPGGEEVLSNASRHVQHLQHLRKEWACNPHLSIQDQTTPPDDIIEGWGDWKSWSRHALYSLRTLHILAWQTKQGKQLFIYHVARDPFLRLSNDYADSLFQDG